MIAVLAFVPVVASADSGNEVYYDAGAYPELPDLAGVYLNGNEVTNIFGYDAKGRRLDDVQLFDQDGRPLATAAPGANGCLDAACATRGLWAPATLRNGTIAWNVYPLQMIEARVGDEGDDGFGLSAAPGAEPQDQIAPFPRVTGLVLPTKDATN